MKIKPHYILLKWNKSYSQNKSKPNYQIWKEYDDTIQYDSPLYSIIEYFDSLTEAKDQLKLLSN